MSLNLFSRSSDMALDVAAVNPVIDLGDSATEAFSAGYDAVRSYRSSDSESTNRYDYVQGVLDKVYKATGETYYNPEMVPEPFGGPVGPGIRATEYAKVRNRLSQLQKERPDLGLGLLTEEEVAGASVAMGQKGQQAEAAASSRVVSRAAGLGSFAGNLVGGLRDPVNIATTIATLPLAVGGKLLTVAAQQAGVGGASEFLVQAMNYDYRKKVDPDYSMAEAAGEVGTAALGAGLLGAGANVSNRVIARAWDSYKGKGAFIPQALKDKANLVKRAAATATNPFKSKSVASEMAHNQAITKAADDIMTGRPVELPPETFLHANARPGRVYDADGRSVGVNYEVVEARDLVTSHTDDFLPNANFPPELQPRARERPITQEQVINMSANLQPERLGPSPQADGGSPIVGPDGLVESGNGRVMAIRKAYQDGNVASGNYRNFLKSQGFDVAEMEAPVLVARRVTDLAADERLKFVTAANRSTAMKLSAPEQALSDARLVDPASLTMLESGDVGSASNRNFVRAFMSKLPRSEQGNLVDAHGNLSLEGNKRLTAALLGRAYGEPTLLARALEDADSNIKSLSGALSDAAGAWSKMRDDVARGIIPQGMDITDDLLSAIRLVMKSRDEGVSLKNLLAQPEMFDGPSDVAKAMARFMFRDGDMSKPAGRASVANMLTTYAGEANKNLAGDRLFGEALSQNDVLKGTLNKAGRSDLVPLAEAATTPEAIQKILNDPAVDDAVLLEGDRMVAQELTGEGPKIMMPYMSIDKAGNEVETMRPMTEVLDELDQQIAAADRIKACTVGTEAAP